MDEYTVEIDEQRNDLVVLAVLALCVLVFGRTLDDAMTRARASIDYRLLEGGHRLAPKVTSRGVTDAAESAHSSAA